MTISVASLAAEDVPSFVRIQLEAFRSHPRTPMMWRNGYNDSVYAYHESETLKDLANPEESRFIKAVDDETGEILGVCEMALALNQEKNAAQRPIDADAPPPADWPKGGNWEMRRYYKINAHGLIMSSFQHQPHIVVNILTVMPGSHGKGIGTKLLTVAIKEADERGVLLGLESTPAGLSLYKRFGFEEQRTIKADMRLFGWDQPYDEEAAKRVWMVRRPRTTA